MTTILAIDDDSTILSIVEVMLEEAGYKILTAENGRQGLEKARTDKPGAIILDRQMPEMDGNQVLIELKADESTRDIPVVMMTNDNRISDVSSCLEMGAVDYIVKPFDKDNFLLRLGRVVKAA